MSKLNENVAVITGAISGKALATAKAFADAGANVSITGRRQDQLNASVEAIGAHVTGVRDDAANLGSCNSPTLDSRKGQPPCHSPESTSPQDNRPNIAEPSATSSMTP
jgi:NAD(P)-dependent dehydrogenase (short-subunit alcohol dehydrogenase family)